MNACRSVSAQVQAGTMSVGDITEQTFSAALSTANCPGTENDSHTLFTVSCRCCHNLLTTFISLHVTLLSRTLLTTSLHIVSPPPQTRTS